MWARAVAPVVEGVARMLGKPRRVRDERTPTPLTGTNRSRGRDAIRKAELRRKVARAAPKVRLLLAVRCGGAVTDSAVLRSMHRVTDER
jgi:hypothetical protein